jgi:hypothetical protein
MNNTETKQAAELLRQHNKWRRGDEEIEMHNPADLGKAIDTVLAALECAEQEIERIKQNHGCARYQGTTRFCAEVVAARKQLADAQRLGKADKARLDWLELQYVQYFDEDSLQVAHAKVSICMPCGVAICPRPVRSAIDAAMSAAADGFSADGGDK